MKCIKHIETGEIKRVSEENALYQTGTGKWSYTPKLEWKKVRDTKNKKEKLIEALEEPSVEAPRPKKKAKKS